MSGPSPRQRKAVFVRDRWKCQACGIRVDWKTATVEHIVPRRVAKGKPWVHGMDNLVTWCKICQQAENDMSNKLGHTSQQRRHLGTIQGIN